MITLSDLFWMCLLFGAGTYWWKAREIKELAHQAAKAHCRRMEVEFLDDSVVLRSVKVRRGDDGRLKLLRGFSFEFSSTGDERYGGTIALLGRRVKSIQLDAHRFAE